MERLKRWFEENIIGSIAIIGGTVAIIIVIIFICFFLKNNEINDNNETKEKSAAGSMSTSINIANSTSEKDSNTNTSLEETQVTTDIETTIGDTLINTTMENETKTQESTTKGQSVKPTQQQTSVYLQPPTQAVTQPPITRPTVSQPPATEAPTTEAPARGKNGIILEKLKLCYKDAYMTEPRIIDLPENNRQLVELSGDIDGGYDYNKDGLGWYFETGSYSVKKYKANIFDNDIYVGQTTIDYLFQIYGEPYKVATLRDIKGYIYRYGVGTTDEKNNIYITFYIPIEGSKEICEINIGNGNSALEVLEYSSD